MLAALRALAADLGRSPAGKELLARPGLPTPITYVNRFGSWNAALEAAGLEAYDHAPTYTKEQLLDVLRDLAADLGRSPIVQDLRDRRDRPSPSAYYRRFGSWNAALEAAGLKLNRRSPSPVRRP